MIQTEYGIYETKLIQTWIELVSPIIHNDDIPINIRKRIRHAANGVIQGSLPIVISTTNDKHWDAELHVFNGITIVWDNGKVLPSDAVDITWIKQALLSDDMKCQFKWTRLASKSSKDITRQTLDTSKRWKRDSHDQHRAPDDHAWFNYPGVILLLENMISLIKALIPIYLQVNPVTVQPAGTLPDDTVFGYLGILQQYIMYCSYKLSNSIGPIRLRGSLSGVLYKCQVLPDFAVRMENRHYVYDKQNHSPSINEYGIEIAVSSVHQMTDIFADRSDDDSDDTDSEYDEDAYED